MQKKKIQKWVQKCFFFQPTTWQIPNNSYIFWEELWNLVFDNYQKTTIQTQMEKTIINNTSK